MGNSVDSSSDGLDVAGNSDTQSNSQSQAEPRVYDYDDPEVPLHNALRKDAARLNMRVEDLEVFSKSKLPFDEIPKDAFTRRNMLAYLRREQTPPPRWMLLTGMLPGMDFDPLERRPRLRHLHKALILIIRRAFLRAAADPFRSERGVYWDPLVEVCDHLQISQSALSRLMKEFSGNNLVQTIDSVRVEGIRSKMKAGVRAYLLGKDLGSCSSRKDAKTQRRKEDEEGEKGESKALGASFSEETWAVWKALRASRKAPVYTPDGWARQLGFASYKRMYRACVVAFDKAPMALELELIEEVLAEKEDVPEKVWTDKELRELIWGLEGYQVMMERVYEERMRNSETTTTT